MARPRKNDPTALLQPIIAEFAERIAALINEQATERMKTEILRVLDNGTAKKTKAARAREWSRCPAPRCRKPFAPRYQGFFSEHRCECLSLGSSVRPESLLV